MPSQTATSSIIAKLGDRAKKAHQQSAAKPVNYGNPTVPAGIEAGVAQLDKITFGTFKEGPNKGKPYFMASGIIKEPREVDGTPVQGLRTQIGPIPLCDTPQSKGKKQKLEDHYDDMLNEVRKLLGKDAEAPSIDELEDVVNHLNETQPNFRFRTWKSNPSKEFPNPRVNHQWNGLDEEYVGSNGQMVTDSTPVGNDADTNSSEPAVDEPDASGGDSPTVDDDLDSLAEAAQAGDEDANRSLQEKAAQAGVDPQEVADAPDWATVVEMIRSASGESGGEETNEEPQEPPDPEKGNLFFYKPTDPKTKKPVKKAIECEVVMVDKKTRTVNLKNMVDKKTIYKGVKWDQLEGS